MGYERTVMKAATATAVAAALAAAGARLLGPATVALVADGLPRAREAATSWMTPPYLYLVINVIIISIAASSRFQPGGSDHSTASTGLEPEQGVADVETAAALLQVAESAVAPGPVVPVQAVGYVVAEEPVVKRNKKLVAAEEPVVKRNNLTEPSPVPALEKEEEEEEEFAIPMSSWTPRRTGAEPVVVDKYVDDEVAPFADMTNSREKPLVSARFSRKATKPSPEGTKALRVARPRKEETLESTWKAITEGRARPLARHLKKSDTWDTRPGRYPSGGGGSGEVDPAPAAAAAAIWKAETFGEGRSKAPSPAPVRREPSPGQDELNRRVEAFINKFNMEMRLQRQESLKHYNEMLRLSGSGGSHY